MKTMKEPPVGAVPVSELPKAEPVPLSARFVTPAERAMGLLSTQEYVDIQKQPGKNAAGFIEHLIDIISEDIGLAIRRCNPWDLEEKARWFRSRYVDRIAQPRLHSESSALLMQVLADNLQHMSRSPGDTEEQFRAMAREIQARFASDHIVLDEAASLVVDLCRLLNGSAQVNTCLDKHNVIL